MSNSTVAIDPSVKNTLIASQAAEFRHVLKMPAKHDMTTSRGSTNVAVTCKLIPIDGKWG